MNVTCPDCRTTYRLDPAKIPSRGVIARCARCPGEFLVTSAEEDSLSARSFAGADPGLDQFTATSPGASEERTGEARDATPAAEEWGQPIDEQVAPPGRAEEFSGREDEQTGTSEGSWSTGGVPDTEASTVEEPGLSAGTEGHDPSASSEEPRPEDDLQQPVVLVPPQLETSSNWEESWRRSETEVSPQEVAEEDDGHRAAEASHGDDLKLVDSTEPLVDAPSDLQSTATTESYEGGSADREPDADERIELVGVGYGEGGEGAADVDGGSSADRYGDSEVPGGTNSDASAPPAAESEEAVAASHGAAGGRELEAASASGAVESVGGAERAETADLRAKEEEATRAGFSVAPTPAAGEIDLPPAPFGSTDPHARAHRLARALVSDIVVYHPDRRERSLRDGTLRQEFREEIRKSWEEYVANVGEQVARDTTYFRDALNDLLAGGSRLF